MLIGDAEFALSHVGPNSVILRDECGAVPPSDAKILIQVEDHLETLDVYLPAGISAGAPRVAYL
jgi:hypothetical protein